MTNISDKAKKDAIAEDAAGWAERLGSRDATVEDRRLFELWKGQSPAHAAAFEEMRGLSGDPTQLPTPAAPRGRLHLLGGGIVALVVLTCLGFIADEVGLIDRFRADYYTPVGVVQRVELEDGSFATLNTNSAIKVKFEQTERRIVLLRGEAFFDVAPNPTRPFVVSGNDTQAIALGTHYAVKVGDHDQIMVEEGHVAVTAGPQRAVLEAGDMVEFGDSGRLLKSTGDVASLTSWRSGKLVFASRPLGDVLAELGRYQRGRILVLDEQTSKLRVSGVFDTVDLDRAFQALQQSLPIKVTRLVGLLTVVQSR